MPIGSNSLPRSGLRNNSFSPFGRNGVATFRNICIKKVGHLKINMEFSALFSTIFIACLLLSTTGYAIYTSFGPAANELRDPFEEHED